jgi:hypothetical protein
MCLLVSRFRVQGLGHRIQGLELLSNLYLFVRGLLVDSGCKVWGFGFGIKDFLPVRARAVGRDYEV